MQDNYIGDIGDYGKYGLLREVCAAGMSLSVNWYKVVPTRQGKQDDGKYISYLSMPQLYREYAPTLFDSLYKIVIQEQERRIERIEQENLFPAVYFSKVLGEDRKAWHNQALEQTQNATVVFLDPDNGLETEKMYQTGSAKVKHVKWTELKDYYARGQNVILYQHRPQMTTKEKCIESKALKLYLFSYRNHNTFHEVAVNSILDDLVADCDPKWMQVIGDFLPRGGIAIHVAAEHGKKD
jgi:hypothetical protein